MKYFQGDCVEITAEISAKKVSGTILTLISVTDPLGNVITLNTIMVFGTEECDLMKASTTYQLDEGATAGRWKYEVQSKNGIKFNYAEGYFFVETK